MSHSVTKNFSKKFEVLIPRIFYFNLEKRRWSQKKLEKRAKHTLVTTNWTNTSPKSKKKKEQFELLLTWIGN